MTVAMVWPASVRLCGMFEIRLAPWLGPTTNRFGKPWTWMPCRLRMPSAQCSVKRPPVAAGDLVARAAGVVGADLEARGVDQAVELVLLAVGTVDHAAPSR